MKAVFSFDFSDPEEERKFKQMAQAEDLHVDLECFRNWLRDKRKYSDWNEGGVMDEVWREFHEHMGDYLVP